MEKQKRNPSEYNKFIGKCTKEKKGPITERMKKCADEWKKEKK
jgi:hypothetical protein